MFRCDGKFGNFVGTKHTPTQAKSSTSNKQWPGNNKTLLDDSPSALEESDRRLLKPSDEPLSLILLYLCNPSTRLVSDNCKQRLDMQKLQQNGGLRNGKELLIPGMETSGGGSCQKGSFWMSMF